MPRVPFSLFCVGIRAACYRLYIYDNNHALLTRSSVKDRMILGQEIIVNVRVSESSEFVCPTENKLLKKLPKGPVL